jgi:diacylglycerol kinase family enzyme
MVRVTLFHNPAAGDAPLTADQLTSILSDAGYQVRYQSTKDDLSAALEDVGELAIVAGGDGTVAKVARALADTDIPLAVLPLGTANNIGKALGVFGDIRDLVGSWPGAARRAIDIGVSSGPFGEERFLESVGSGAFAELVRRGRTEVDEAAAIVHRETDRALQLMASILREARAEDWQLELDDHDLSGSYLAVEAMNIPFVGPNIPLAGDAEMDDGELDLVLLRDEDRERLLGYVIGRVESASAVMPSLDVRRGRRIRMTPPAGWQLRIDDELVELDAGADTRAVDILLRPGVVHVIGGRRNGDRA